MARNMVSTSAVRAFTYLYILTFVCSVATFTYLSLLTFVCSVTEVNSSSSTLKSVVIIHRHGDRNPISLGPKDPHKDPSEWPDGLGQLTKAGKLRMYYLGLHIRKRYADFLTDKIDEVYARAADMDRCIASAQLVLSALYRPAINSTSRWNPRLSWQPIPIHTVPEDIDALLETKAACPRIKRELAELEDTVEVREIYNSLDSLLELVKRDLGIEPKAFEQIFWLYGDLTCYNESGKSLPSWYNASNRLLLEQAAVKVTSLFTSSELLKKLQSGPILQEIYSKLTNSHYIDGEDIEHEKKFFEYSTHDTELINLMRTLDVWDCKLPNYGSTLFFELHQNEINGTDYVKLYRLNNLSVEAHELPMDCGQPKEEPCYIEHFASLVQSLQTQDWAATCRV